MDRSLRGLMMINRFTLKRVAHRVLLDPTVIPPIIPTPPVVQPIPQIPSGDYVLSDFGENAINNHCRSDQSHSERVQLIFNYVTREFRERCTSFQSYNTDLLGDTLINASNVLHYSKIVNSDIILTPYVGAASWMEHEYHDFVLPVSSHWDNDGQGDIHVGSDNNRHDITSGPGVILPHSVAVSSRRDTPSEFKNSTSEGYGMEFFEDCSPEGLDSDYSNKDVPRALAYVTTNSDGTIISTVQSNCLTFTNQLKIGDEITIRYAGHNEIRTIAQILSPSSYRVVNGYTPIAEGIVSCYAWIDGTLGEYQYGQAESWAIPIVAGKLKVIKMTTGADWNTVRMAARATAKRNLTGISEIDNSNWDIYRGFGCIQVNDAINYINNN